MSSETVQGMIGKLVPDDWTDRDAIHIAVIPMTADSVLLPGQGVNVGGNHLRPYVGIVDPFLQDVVQPGQRFFLFLTPNTVTGITHHWHHPLFDGRAVLRAYLTRYAPDKETAK